MGSSSQGSAAVAAARVDLCALDLMPVFAKEMIAGGVAGAFSKTAIAPLERVKILLQVNSSDQLSGALKRVNPQPTYGGIMDVFRGVYSEGGVRALYRGVGPTLMGILPYAGLKFYIYEGLKAHVPEDYKNSVTLKLSCGAAAGLFGQTLTYPLDVVRRQMQVQSQQQHEHFGCPRITGTFQGLMVIKQTQGWRQLFAGLSLNYIKVVPSVAIGFTAYDTMKHLLKIPPREKKRSGDGPA
ncbi:hypothetical protein BAE44_0017751 [Dichanthelium oligosanthes]|uniref:Graves disease carrier protein n=1 Tax=Dichanthelium oligosanthes TaxID=888268 RepID=A0A1E5V7Y3_9POAL|nr:hypothetical protein BAE44_0017751 [Dichanthelium oligosanthes]